MLRTIVPQRNSDVKPFSTPSLEGNFDLIKKIAWNFARDYNLEFDDLFQEACIIAIKAIPRYKPEVAKFSTFLWITVSNGLRDLMSKNATYNRRHLLTDDFSLQEHTESVSPTDTLLAEEEFSELWATLSPAAQELCRMIITGENLYHHTESGKFRRVVYLPTDRATRCRAILRQVLEQKGWTKTRIQEVFREIKTALAT